MYYWLLMKRSISKDSGKHFLHTDSVRSTYNIVVELPHALEGRSIGTPRNFFGGGGYARNFFRGGGSTISVEDRGQRERVTGGGSLLVRGSTLFANV
jgi:hypothetical protein